MIDLSEASSIDIMRVVLARWRIVGVSVLLSIGAAFFYLATTPRIYEVDALILPVADSQGSGLAGLASQFGGLASLAGIQVGGSGGAQEVSIATLSSRKAQEAFIVDNGLMQVFYADSWDTTTKRFEPNWMGRVPNIDGAIELWRKRIFRISDDRRSGLIKVTVRYTDPELCARWIDSYVRTVNDIVRKSALDEAERSIQYLQRELERTQSIEVRESIFRMLESQVKQAMLANVRDEYAFRVIDPPVAPDRDFYASPRKKVVLVIFALLGAIFGGIGALVLESVRAPTASVRSVPR